MVSKNTTHIIYNMLREKYVLQSLTPLTSVDTMDPTNDSIQWKVSTIIPPMDIDREIVDF